MDSCIYKILRKSTLKEHCVTGANVVVKVEVSEKLGSRLIINFL